MSVIPGNSFEKGKAIVGGRNLITRAARWSAVHPWWAMTLWVVFVLGALVVGGMTGTRSATVSDLAIGQSGRAAEISKSGGLENRAVENILVTPYEGTLDQDRARAAADDAADALRGAKGVTAIGNPCRRRTVRPCWCR